LPPRPARQLVHRGPRGIESSSNSPSGQPSALKSLSPRGRSQQSVPARGGLPTEGDRRHERSNRVRSVVIGRPPVLPRRVAPHRGRPRVPAPSPALERPRRGDRRRLARFGRGSSHDRSPRPSSSTVVPRGKSPSIARRAPPIPRRRRALRSPISSAGFAIISRAPNPCDSYISCDTITLIESADTRRPIRTSGYYRGRRRAARRLRRGAE
jgi:hypothetical protein